MRSRIATAACAVALLVPGGCRRQGAYPDAPLLILCPWAVGGGTDRVSRQIAAFLEVELGVPVNVINATGGDGVTGHSRGARARPDGYTLTMMTVEINMLRWRKLTEISWEDFTPLMLINRDAAAIFVRDDAPWRDLHDLEAGIRVRPGQLTASGTATGGIWHLAVAGWVRTIGLEPSAVKWVPAGGAGPSLKELASGGMGLLGFALERYGVPLGPVVLGIVLGNALEHAFIQNLIKSDSPLDFLGFSRLAGMEERTLARPLSLLLGLVFVGAWAVSGLLHLRGRRPRSA